MPTGAATGLELQTKKLFEVDRGRSLSILRRYRFAYKK